MAESLAAIPAYERNSAATVRLAIAAHAHLKQMADDEGIYFDCKDRGILQVYKTRAEFEHAERVTQMLKRAGLERQGVTPAQIRTMEPALQGGPLRTWKQLSNWPVLYGVSGLARALVHVSTVTWVELETNQGTIG